MANVSEASLSDLAEELTRADVAIALGIQPRKWAKYRKAILGELMRRTEPPAGTPPVTDEELMAELSGFDGGDGIG